MMRFIAVDEYEEIIAGTNLGMDKIRQRAKESFEGSNERT